MGTQQWSGSSRSFSMISSTRFMLLILSSKMDLSSAFFRAASYISFLSSTPSPFRSHSLKIWRTICFNFALSSYESTFCFSTLYNSSSLILPFPSASHKSKKTIVNLGNGIYVLKTYQKRDAPICIVQHFNSFNHSYRRCIIFFKLNFIPPFIFSSIVFSLNISRPIISSF